MNGKNRSPLVLAVAGPAIVLCLLSAFETRSAEEPNSGWNPSTPLPSGELGKVVALGREIVESTNTHPLSKPYVDNALTCSSCHLDAGTHPRAATFLDIAAAYPAWSPRERRVITLEDRVLNCFMRSMNGVRPPNGSRVSVAVTAYITWLSSGSRIRMNPESPWARVMFNHWPLIRRGPIRNGAKSCMSRSARIATAGRDRAPRKGLRPGDRGPITTAPDYRGTASWRRG